MFESFFRKSRPTDAQTKVDAPEIGCIAQEIISDMSIENCANWRFDEGASGKWFSCQGKRYNVHFCSGRRFRSISIMGTLRFKFSPSEQDALWEAYGAMMVHKKEQDDQKITQRDNQFLSEIFPNCKKV